MNSDAVATLPPNPPPQMSEMGDMGDMGDKVATLPPQSAEHVATVAIAKASRTVVKRALVLPRGDDDRGLTSPSPPGAAPPLAPFKGVQTTEDVPWMTDAKTVRARGNYAAPWDIIFSQSFAIVTISQGASPKSAK